MVSIDFSPEQLRDFYRGSTNEGRQAIKVALGENLSEVLPITERVKTYEDAVRELGENHPYVEFANSASWRYEGKEGADIVAYLKLRVITAALNEGWEPQYTEDEKRWYAWYNLYTQDEIDDMSEEEKKNIGLLLWGGDAINGSLCGLAFALSNYAWSLSSSRVGSRLVFKSQELAEYAAKQFIEIYADFCFKPASKEEKK